MATISVISAEDVLLQHPLGVKERSVDGNRVPHDIDEVVAMIIKHREDHLLELLIKGQSVSLQA